MNYAGRARRAELQFSARAFALVAVIACGLALWGWLQLHDATVTGFHLAVAAWCARQAHLDSNEAHTGDN
jgi:hypothetical protein